MSTVDRWGIGVQRVIHDRADIEKSKDMIIIGLRSQRLTWREIGRILGVSHVAVFKRWKAIPEAARSHYSQEVG